MDAAWAGYTGVLVCFHVCTACVFVNDADAAKTPQGLSSKVLSHPKEIKASKAAPGTSHSPEKQQARKNSYSVQQTWHVMIP